MVGPGGLEPPTPRLSSACSNQLSYEPEKLSPGSTRGGWRNHWLARRSGWFCPARLLPAARGHTPGQSPVAAATAETGADRVRTGDPLLAKQVLYQLSYDPVTVGNIVVIKNDLTP